jgi:hypothetical protein
VLAIALFAHVGCGGKSHGSDAGPIDAALPDAARDAAPDAAAGAVGGTCQSDGDCRSGLTCSNEANQGQFDAPYFPSHGLCTLKCASNTECQAVVPGGVCTSRTGAPVYCLPGCDPAGAATGPLDANKCLGRPDLACTSRSSCTLNCNDDSDCPAGRICSGLQGKCEVGTRPGRLVDQIGQTTSCPGGLGLSNPSDGGVQLVCSAFCTVGVARSCGWDGVTRPVPTLCRGRAVGDQGSCVRLCDCDAECPSPLGCTPLDAGEQAQTGRQGYCFGHAGQSTLTCAADAGTD